MNLPLAKPLPAGFAWCPGCQAAREPWHRHGDPLEAKTREELLELLRQLQPPESRPLTALEILVHSEES